ncbi:expressed unknown protein [Seminavis robusta]|uniref:Uncharacterized protein n=1 Tax=Seminavis robusta TaxID=568900 RepID=A0A9N8H939_9STRA|nr:expressed unknown protein [Seminavis robusta]|eukprot:Sro178_g078140.1 n/a (348) ;mRNA; r:38465-39508
MMCECNSNEFISPPPRPDNPMAANLEFNTESPSLVSSMAQMEDRFEDEYTNLSFEELEFLNHHSADNNTLQCSTSPKIFLPDIDDDDDCLAKEADGIFKVEDSSLNHHDASFESVGLTPFTHSIKMKPGTNLPVPNIITTTTTNKTKRELTFSPIQKFPTQPNYIATRRKVLFVTPKKALLQSPASISHNKMRRIRKTPYPKSSPGLKQQQEQNQRPPKTPITVGGQGRAFRSPAVGFYGNKMMVTTAYSSCFDTPHPNTAPETTIYTPGSSGSKPEAVPQEWLDLYHARPSASDDSGRTASWIRKVLGFRRKKIASPSLAVNEGEGNASPTVPTVNENPGFVDVLY